MVGRLSTYAKNRILQLRFQKNKKITQISRILENDDNIKVSRESVSAFLKKYIETKSINDKPRTGRKRKLSDKEIELIGEITKEHPDITAPKLKEYLNLNVSSYTVLRASKQFEWNKINPNSNEAKRQAALERELNGEKKRKSYPKKKRKLSSISKLLDEKSIDLNSCIEFMKTPVNDSHNLYLLTNEQILCIKNLSSSPMVFGTKLLFKLFKTDELKDHYVFGNGYSRTLKNKKPLIDKRVLYIKWLIENNFDASDKEELWQQCRKSLNKNILRFERRGFRNMNETNIMTKDTIKTIKSDDIPLTMDFSVINCKIKCEEDDDENSSEIELNRLSKTPFHQSTDDSENSETGGSNDEDSDSDSGDEDACSDGEDDEDEVDDDDEVDDENNDETSGDDTEFEGINRFKSILDNCEISKKLNENEIIKIRSSTCSPTVFGSKLLFKLFKLDELYGHSVNRERKNCHRKQLDQLRISYIKYLVETHFKIANKAKLTVWRGVCKAMNRSIRISEAKLNKSRKSKATSD